MLLNEAFCCLGSMTLAMWLALADAQHQSCTLHIPPFSKCLALSISNCTAMQSVCPEFCAQDLDTLLVRWRIMRSSFHYCCGVNRHSCHLQQFTPQSGTPLPRSTSVSCPRALSRNATDSLPEVGESQATRVNPCWQKRCVWRWWCRLHPEDAGIVSHRCTPLKMCGPFSWSSSHLSPVDLDAQPRP